MFDFVLFPVIRTSRLTLRCLTSNDASDIFTIRSDYEVTKYNSGAAYTDIAQGANLIARSIDGFKAKRSIYWAIVLNEDSSVVIGQLGFNNWDQDNHSAEVGFDLRRDCWRKGIMQEALSAIIKFGLDEMHLNRIGAQVSSYNEASKQLLLKLLFKLEGTQREQYYEQGAYHDLDLFALLKRDCSDELLSNKCEIAYVETGFEKEE